MPIALISYPRSGNHLARAILEYGTGRPTIGVRASDTDPPIYLREPNKRAGLINVTDECPVAWKAHTLSDLQANARISGHLFTRLVLIVRPPEKCITSQVYRDLSPKPDWRVRNRHIGKAVYQASLDYLSLLGIHVAWPEDRRLLVSFDDLIQNDETAEQLIKFAGGNKTLDHETLQSLRELARDSQESLGKIAKPALYDRISKVVTSIIPRT